VNNTPVFQVVECHFQQTDGIVAEAAINYNNQVTRVKANGNGRLDAVSNVIKQYFGISYELSVYEEHSLSRGSSSKAVAYVGIVCSGKKYWGVGIDEDIIKASINALIVAVNQVEGIRDKNMDARMNEILNFIQENYTSITLENLSEHFHLSKPYMSKYIKEKSGETFGDIVKNIRMKKAKTLLKNTSMTVENISRTLGYDNVEHFSRSFKKTFDMTPIQYRNMR
jgi:2-isopropylmalate synthase